MLNNTSCSCIRMQEFDKDRMSVNDCSWCVEMVVKSVRYRKSKSSDRRVFADFSIL